MIEQSISWKRLITITIAVQILNFIIFLMVEVFWADLIRNYLQSLDVGDVYFIPLLILLIGMIISMVISIVLFSIFVKTKKSRLVLIFLLSFFLTFVTILVISIISIELYYSEIMSEYSVMHKFSMFPQYITFFAIYILDSPVVLWDITSIIFGLYSMLLIKKYIKVKYKGKKKVKPLFERMI